MDKPRVNIQQEGAGGKTHTHLPKKRNKNGVCLVLIDGKVSCGKKNTGKKRHLQTVHKL